MDHTTKISIGLPIYNGEKFIRRRLDNILSQTFQDFEIIIYDNSNDSTPQICKEYELKEKRIQYTYENKRSGWIQGWINVVKKAKYKYFVITSVDDLWSSNFLEENIRELEENPSAVASIGIMEEVKNTTDNSMAKPKDTIKNKIYKKIQRIFTHSILSYFEAHGSFQNKANLVLRKTWYRHLNGVIRTNELKKSIIEKDLFLWDWAMVLNLIKYGNLHITTKTKYFVYYGFGETVSRKGILHLLKAQKARKNEYFFPASTFTFWCIKNVGLKFFLKNIDYFIWLNFIHVVGVWLAVYRKIIN